ncbi:hypothetical protein OAV62_02115 [bacterium]|nr:hypothetical protein [bacterium]
MAKINEYPLERFTFGDDDYYDIDYWDGAVYQSAKIKGSTIKAAMSGGGSILAADGQVMPADRSQDLANFKLSLRDGVFTLGTVDADFGSIFQATKESGNTYATIKTKTNDNAGLILDINTADATGAGNKTAMVQFRDAGVTKYIFGTNTDGVANFSDNSFFISSSALLTDYIQAIDRDTESFVIGRQIGNALNDNAKFLINNGNSFNTTELDNVLVLSSRDETKKWLVDKDMIMSHTKAQSLELTSIDKGVLLNRVTTAQMNAIASPATSLLVYDTDLNRYEYYNGTTWTPLSVGFDIIEVIRDSDNGVPTFFSDLQTALETCKSSGSNNVVKLHSDITLTSQIDINYGGVGVGGGYRFESLTIDFNGFKVTFDDTGADDAFNVNFANLTYSNQHIRFLNGVVSRLSGTGTHNAVSIEPTQYGRVSMSDMIVYCENSQAANIVISESTTFNGQRCDLGGSIFVNNASSGLVCSFMSGDNFKVIALGNSDGFRPSSIGCENVYVECKGTGTAVGNVSYTYLKDCTLVTNSGRCADVSDFLFDNCKFYSTSGYLIYGGVDTIANHCYGVTGNNSAVHVCGEINHSTFINNSSNLTVRFAIENNNSIFINNGSGGICDINAAFRKFFHCKLISVGGTPVTSSGSGGGDLFNCFIESQYNNASGHAISFGHTSGVVNISNCVVKVSNTGANCFEAGAALNIEATNNTLIGATTPINANVTINASTDEGNGNRSF